MTEHDVHHHHHEAAKHREHAAKKLTHKHSNGS